MIPIRDWPAQDWPMKKDDSARPALEFGRGLAIRPAEPTHCCHVNLIFYSVFWCASAYITNIVEHEFDTD